MKSKKTARPPVSSSPPAASEPNDDTQLQLLSIIGRDEMNLVEFPFATLRNRGDSRKAIVYEGWVTDKNGNRLRQKWTVQGGSLTGLPNEGAERIYVALMTIAAQEAFKERRTPFSFYQLAKIMQMPLNQKTYQEFETWLKQITAVTIDAEGAFWDSEKKETVKTLMGFHIIEKYWLRIREKDEQVIEDEGVPAYVVWSEQVWKSIRSGYVKSLDTGFYFKLKNPISRRLYRLLDKRLYNKPAYEFDVFDLAAKLGMTQYKFPAEIRKKLRPAIDELISAGFLASAAPIKVDGYSRLRFVKGTGVPVPLMLDTHQSPSKPPESPDTQAQSDTSPQEALGLVLDLVTLGMSPKTAQELVTAYEAATIEQWLDALSTMEQQGKPKTNPAGFLIHVLKTHTPPPAFSKTKAEQLTEREKEAERSRQLITNMARAEEDERLREHERQAKQEAALAHLHTTYGTTEEEIALWEKVKQEVRENPKLVDLRPILSAAHLVSLKGNVAIMSVLNQWHLGQLTFERPRIQQVFKRLGYEVRSIQFVDPPIVP